MYINVKRTCWIEECYYNKGFKNKNGQIKRGGLNLLFCYLSFQSLNFCITFGIIGFLTTSSSLKWQYPI